MVRLQRIKYQESGIQTTFMPVRKWQFVHEFVNAKSLDFLASEHPKTAEKLRNSMNYFLKIRSKMSNKKLN
jgi:hypothetical protein